MILSTTAKWKKLSLILFVFIVLLPATAFAKKQEQEYRTALYSEGKYSAYAYAVASDGQLTCDVYLQYLPGYSFEEAITGYTIEVNGKALETEMKPTQNAADKGISTHFSVTEQENGDIHKIVLRPHTASGKLTEEEIVLYDAASESNAVAQTAVVNNPVATDKLNLRIAPNGDADSLRQYYNGVQVEVLAMMPGNWAAVSIGQAGGMARGYMKADYLAFDADGEAVESVMPSHTAIVDSWTLYSYPDEDSLPVAQYGKGQVFTVLARSSTWWHIAVGDVTGFVRADVLVQLETPPAPSPSATTALPTALEQMSQEAVLVEDAPDINEKPSATPASDLR